VHVIDLREPNQNIQKNKNKNKNKQNNNNNNNKTKHTRQTLVIFFARYSSHVKHFVMMHLLCFLLLPVHEKMLTKQ